ncbi:hypothetical protein [Paenibacillus radicibacter]|uniref:hypothetical protein n=1 Tax=Paenibacillus radicibacter TaxID=2972488 RepID=UPI00280BDE5D|nr:hypothetical protein [Paenibacillus radicibacter]
MKIVDMEDEIISEVLFEHGVIEAPFIMMGSTVLTHGLGLQQFEVVNDTREGKQMRSKVVDIEIDMLSKPEVTRVILEPVQLIVGQHDVGLIIQ